MSNVYGITVARLPGSLQRMNSCFSPGLYSARLLAIRASILALAFLVLSCIGQEPAKAPETPVTSVDTTLPVNWIYGAYIPKDAPF
jgi:hypothetical protein